MSLLALGIKDEFLNANRFLELLGDVIVPLPKGLTPVP